MQNDGNLNQSEKIPLHSFVGSKAKSLCSLYCCSHLGVVKYKHWPLKKITYIPAAWPAQHFIMLSLADLHMNVLFKGIQIEQCQGVISCVGCPIGCSNAYIHFTGIPDIENRNFVFAKTKFVHLHRLSCILNHFWLLYNLIKNFINVITFFQWIIFQCFLNNFFNIFFYWFLN